MKGVARKRTQALAVGSGRVAQPSRDAGAHRGSLAGYHGPQIYNRHAEQYERHVMQRRTEDLFANDWAARSGIDAIANNAVGTGLVPQALPASELLGISKEESRAFARSMERVWKQWTSEAHYASQLHFADLQYLGLRTLLKTGEMLHVPVMLSEAERVNQGRTFSLCIQNLAPQRLVTPADYVSDPLVYDGVHMSSQGGAQGYYIALPQDGGVGAVLNSSVSAPSSTQCAYLPARIGHRPGVFHIFRHDTDEQVRGISPLATGIRLFRHLADALDYELYAQVIAAAFPIFFATEHPPTGMAAYPGIADMSGAGPSAGTLDTTGQERSDYLPIEPGSMLYGAQGEKPEILESKRPSANFASFVEIIMRAMSASLGIPYESLSKDFSKTNYSSARAALNEAWKMYLFYRQWYARMYCQPIFEMVMEEAYLRNLLVLPRAAQKGFYEARKLWCSASWVGPARGSIDPVKEITAIVTAVDNKLMTYGEAWKERGGDFDEGLEIMMDEAKRMADLPSKEDKTATTDHATHEADDQDSEHQQNHTENDDA